MDPSGLEFIGIILPPFPAWPFGPSPSVLPPQQPPNPFTTGAAGQYAKNHIRCECLNIKSAVWAGLDEFFDYDLAGIIENEARNPNLGLPDRQNSALRHCVAGGLMARSVGCACAQCLEDNRDISQWYGAGQTWNNTIQALPNDREGRWCGGCLGKGGKQDPNRYRSGEDIVNCCKKKLANRGLITDGPLPNSPTFNPTVPPNWWNGPKPPIVFPGPTWW